MSTDKVSRNINNRRQRLKRVLCLLCIAIVIGLVIFVLRGPHISNTLKKLILPELEAVSGKKVIAQKIYINIFPLFIEAKGVKVFDENGNRMLFANRIKGYINLSGILNKTVSIRRLVIKEPDISTDRQKLDEVINNVKAHLEKDKKPAVNVSIKAVEVVEGAISLRDEEADSQIDVKGFKGDMVLGENPRCRVGVKQFDIKKEGWPELTGDLDALFIVGKNRIEIKNIEVGSYGSKVKGEGFYQEGKGTLRTEIALLVDSVKNIFKLKQKGDGRISAKGEVRTEEFRNWKDIFIDLKLNGDFHVQTLMELLNVEEKIEGFVDFQGEVQGHLADISGKAKARLQKGNLFGVEIDSLRCEVMYHDGVMRFKDGVSELYRGRAQAEATLHLTGSKFFALNVKFDSIDSRAALKLIGWEPEIPTGRVNGELITSGREFNPDGWVIYKAMSREDTHTSDNVLSRIKSIKGNYSLRNNILSLSDMKMSTALSHINVDGTVHINKKTLDLTVKLSTNEISDLILPYYEGLKGQGYFSGDIKGTFDNIEISGENTVSNASVEGYKAERIAFRFSYNKNLLSIYELVLTSTGEEHRLSGKIYFPAAKELFDFSKAVYKMNATLKNAEFGKAVQIFSKDLPATGRVDADIKIGGRDKDIEITGNATVEKASVYKIPFDTATAAFSYINKELSLRQIVIKRNTSTLTAEGKLFPDKKFSYKASSNRIFIKDIGLKYIPGDTLLTLHSEGSGTFTNPFITLSAQMTGGTIKGRPIGNSTINAIIKNMNISLNALLFNEKVKLKGNGRLEEKFPWTAEIDMQPGRYDFIVSSILKEVPEDLLLNLKGHVEMSGDKKHITASINLNRITLALFGQSFSNDSDVKIKIDNEKISFNTFSMQSGSTSFRLRGGLEIGREFDISLEGSSSLSPLKGLSRKIEHLSGDTRFGFSMSGKWDRPKINGGLSVVNASFGIKGYPQHISSINGHLDFNDDRIIVQKFSGRLGGGEVKVSGLVYLKEFGVNKFSLEAHCENVTAAVSKDFTINLGGDLLYRGTTTAASITGDIKINRAKYKERVEWKSWLLMTKAKERPKSEISEFEKTDLNIRVLGSDNIYIDNNIARTPVRIDIVVRGTISHPILFGRFESQDGNVYFRNNEFRIIHASADFADPNKLNPFIDLSAETSVKGYAIRLNLEGQIEHFNLSLSSIPPLEEMDILALLTVGKIGKKLKGLEGGIGAGEATSFLTGKIQDVLEERLRTITGLDRIEIDPHISETTGTVGPRVTASKRLIGDTLLVTYTSALGATEEQIIKMEYILTKNVSLIGMRDEKGSVGGDIKFRFEFK